MNATILRFGYPETLIASYDHWVVLLRPEQPTLGSLILAARSGVRAFGKLPAAAFAELATVSEAIEGALAAAVGFQKINYLMLMMVDPHVHFHVIPRYSGARCLDGFELIDHGWPRAPQLSPAHLFEVEQREALIGRLKAEWP